MFTIINSIGLLGFDSFKVEVELNYAPSQNLLST